MKWTSGMIAELREMAPTAIGAAAIADRLGQTRDAVIAKAHRLGVRIIDRNGFLHPTADEVGYRKIERSEYVRDRWSKLIGRMKEQLRADIGSM